MPLQDLIKTHNLDLIFLTETWLDSKVDDSHFNLRNFQIFRSDRTAKKGGGVAIIIKDVFPAVRIESIVPDGALHDLVCVDLHTNNQHYRLICVYRPPGDADSGRCDSLLLINRLNKLLTRSRITFLLGDFNLPLVNWKNMTYPSDGIHDCLLSFCQQHSLDQLVSEPTRYDNILDLLFVSDPHVVTNYIITPPLSTGDHNVVLFSTVGLVSADNHEIVRESISIALWNEDAISTAEQFLYSFDWSSIFVYSISPEEIWQGFKNVLLHCVSTFAKIKLYHGSDDRSLELNFHTKKDIKRLTTSKKYLWQKLRNKRNPNRNLLLNKYKAVCKLICSKIRLAKLHVEKTIINSNDVKKFYKFANQKLSNKKKRIQTIQSPSGKLTIDSF